MDVRSWPILEELPWLDPIILAICVICSLNVRWVEFLNNVIVRLFVLTGFNLSRENTEGVMSRSASSS